VAHLTERPGSPTNPVEQPDILLGVLVIAFLALSLGVHEAAHAWTANRCGDPTAKEMGRLTLSPFAHIDLFMSILLPLMLFLSGAPIFGGAKPVPVNPHRLRHPLRDMSLVALAGPASNVLLAVLFILIWKGVVYSELYPPESLLSQVMYSSIRFNILLAVFNMIPIPPLDGSRIMAYVLPASLREGYVRMERFGMLMVIGVVFFIPQTRILLLTAMSGMMRGLDTLTGGVWFVG
jgi:Zn-dependent protease